MEFIRLPIDIDRKEFEQILKTSDQSERLNNLYLVFCRPNFTIFYKTALKTFIDKINSHIKTKRQIYVLPYGDYTETLLTRSKSEDGSFVFTLVQGYSFKDFLEESQEYVQYQY